MQTELIIRGDQSDHFHAPHGRLQLVSTLRSWMQTCLHARKPIGIIVNRGEAAASTKSAVACPFPCRGVVFTRLREIHFEEDDDDESLISYAGTRARNWRNRLGSPCALINIGELYRVIGLASCLRNSPSSVSVPNCSRSLVNVSTFTVIVILAEFILAYCERSRAPQYPLPRDTVTLGGYSAEGRFGTLARDTGIAKRSQRTVQLSRDRFLEITRICFPQAVISEGKASAMFRNE